jgi:succinate dehydrogenase/fumarate reductase flavoprotein subunit
MLDVVIVDGRARGIIARNLVTGKLERFAAHAVVIATGGYGNAYFLSTNAMGCNCSAAMSCYRKGAYFANPSYVQIHPTCIPIHGDKQSKLTLMSESLRNDGRIWVPKKLEDAKKLQEGTLRGEDIPDEDRDFYLERRYPAFGNLVPRDVASRAAKERCDKGFGVNNTGLAVFLDFKYAIDRLGKDVVAARYGNLFDMYEEMTQRIQRTTISVLLKVKVEVRPAPMQQPINVVRTAPVQPTNATPAQPTQSAAKPATPLRVFRRQMPEPLSNMSSFKAQQKPNENKDGNK